MGGQVEPLKFRDNKEARIQEAIKTYLQAREWVVKVTHGNAFQSGFPDLWAGHSVYGHRWIEVKVAEQFTFTPAQVKDFPKMVASGGPIWILTEACDPEYEKLFRPFNFYEYFSCFLHGCRNIKDWRGGRA